MKVDPTELQLTADQLDGHSSSFLTAHQSSQSRASQAALGGGASAAALPEMLAAWDRDGARFAERFSTHAESHREAATEYTATDGHSAEGIDDAGSAL